jgi:SAM-dependent methyltransferase
MDPLAGSQWSASGTVAGFATSAPNAVLMKFAEEELRHSGSARALDLGCGAGRNAVPLARLGWQVVGIDLSWPMLRAAATRTREDRLDDRLHLVLAPMERIPARDRSFDLVIAHGIWSDRRPSRGGDVTVTGAYGRGDRSRRVVMLAAYAFEYGERDDVY